MLERYFRFQFVYSGDYGDSSEEDESFHQLKHAEGEVFFKNNEKGTLNLKLP